MQESPQIALSQQEAPSPNDRKPKVRNRMLVVEDAQCVQKIVGMLLGKMNIEVETAENGQVACEMAEKSKNDGAPYDLILMDVQMPVMNGCDATRRLRQHGWEGPIVAVSAYATDEDHEQFLRAGCNGGISKPLTEAKLRSVFAQHLKLD